MELRRKFEAGEFAILAEIEPPKGVDVSAMVAHAKRVRGEVDAFLVPEMSNAVMRMSSLGGAMILRQNGLETVIQLNCRDRNRIALQADLLAAHACGIPNVMAVTGEDPGFGDHHQARAVHDIDLATLLQTISGLQAGRDMAGIELSGTPRYLIGSTADVGAKGKSPELVLEEMNAKVEAGARFFVTPPIFDVATLRPFLSRLDTGMVTLVPTVLLLKSVGMARYIARNLNHIFIPDALITRLQKAPDKVRECIRIAAEIAAAVRSEGIGGVLFSTLGWENRLPEILERL